VYSSIASAVGGRDPLIVVVGPCQGLLSRLATRGAFPLHTPWEWEERAHCARSGGAGFKSRREAKEKEKTERENALSRRRRCCIVYDIQDKPAAAAQAQPYWIPLAAVDQNYKAERTSQRPLGIPLSMPRIFFLFLQSSPFSSLRRKGERGRFENATKIDRYFCPLFFNLANEQERANLARIRVSSRLFGLSREQPFIG